MTTTILSDEQRPPGIPFRGPGALAGASVNIAPVADGVRFAWHMPLIGSGTR